MARRRRVKDAIEGLLRCERLDERHGHGLDVPGVAAEVADAVVAVVDVRDDVGSGGVGVVDVADVVGAAARRARRRRRWRREGGAATGFVSPHASQREDENNSISFSYPAFSQLHLPLWVVLGYGYDIPPKEKLRVHSQKNKK